AAAAVVGVWLAGGKAVPRWWRARATWAALALVLTTVLLKSVNSWIATAFGVSLLVVSTRLRTTVLLFATIAAIVVYVSARASGLWMGREIVSAVELVQDQDKIRSVRFRIDNENRIAPRARERPLLGWGRWGDYLIDDVARPAAIPDSFW